MVTTTSSKWFGKTLVAAIEISDSIGSIMKIDSCYVVSSSEGIFELGRSISRLEDIDSVNTK